MPIAHIRGVITIISPTTALSAPLIEVNLGAFSEPWMILLMFLLCIIGVFFRYVLPHVEKRHTAVRVAKMTPKQASQAIEALRALSGQPEKEDRE